MITKIINANPHGPLSRRKLDNFERRAHLSLQTDFREFLLQFNGGQPTPSFFWINPYIDGSSVYQFYGLHDGPKHLSIETFVGEERFGFPSSMLPIGDDGVGNFICVGTSSSNLGEVFFLDHDQHPFHDPNSLEGVIKVANNFTEFLNSFRESPD